MTEVIVQSTPVTVVVEDETTGIIDVITSGPQGPAGEAASVSVGTTATGAPGTNAQVTNSGTEMDAVLNFVIPRGAQGEKGETGDQGAPGPNAIGGYGFSISNISQGDVLSFGTNTWTNTPQTQLTDGGNF